MNRNLSLPIIVGLAIASSALNTVQAAVENVAWLQGNRLDTGSPDLISATPTAVRWNVRSSIDPGVFEHSFESITQLVIRQDGDYLVAATLPVFGNAGDRPTQAIEVYVNGAPAAGALSQCSYVRNTSNANESSDHVNALLSGLTAGDVIELMIYKTANPAAVTTMETASLFVERVASGRSVFAATSEGTADGDPNLLRDFTQVAAAQLAWNGQRKDSGFAHSDGQAGITLQNAGDYLVFVNIPLEGAVQRASVGMTLLLDGAYYAPVGLAQEGYIRNSNAHIESSIHFAGFVRTTSANQVLTVETLLRSPTSGTVGPVTIQPGKAASIIIERFAGSSGVYSSTATEVDSGSTPTDWNQVDKTAVRWKAPKLIDSATYSHSVDGTDIQVRQAGSYLLVFHDDVEQIGTDRSNLRITVEVNGEEQPGAQTKCHYIRDDQGHNQASGTLVYLLLGLSANDIVTVSTQREAAGGTVGLIGNFAAQDAFPEEVAKLTLIRRPDFTPDPANPAPPRLVFFEGDVFGFGARLEDLGLSVNGDTIQVTLDGVDVTDDSQVSKVGTITEVTYAYPPLELGAPGSRHAVVVSFDDTSDPPQNHQVPVSFTATTAYTVIPPEFAATGVNTSQPGFVANATQISTLQSGVDSLHGNNLDNVERQLAGDFSTFPPSLTGEPYRNEADPQAANDWQIVPMDVPGIINFEQGDTGTPGPAGNFTVDNGYPDDFLPRIPGWGAAYDGIAIEFLTFVELPAGFLTLGVNSDDAFRLTTGPAVKDLLGVTLGFWNGGRGAADSLFNVLVKDAGIYPMRLIYSEGNGGASVEFFSVAADGSKIPVNASAPQALKAYRTGPTRPYISRIVSPTGTISPWIEIDITDGTVSVADGSVQLALDGKPLTASVTKAGGVTTVAYDNGGPFTGGSHVVTLAYDETSTPVVTRRVDLDLSIPAGLVPVLEDAPFAYWRLGETEGVQAFSEVGSNLTSTYFNAPVLGQPRLVVGDTSPSVLFEKDRVTYLDIPDHPEINDSPNNTGWKYKTVELWFKARHLPTTAPLGGGSAAGIAETQVIYEQGGITRGITIYLRGTQAGPAPAEAQLWVNILNRAEQAWGGCLPTQPTDAGGATLSPNGDPVAVNATIQAGELYHLVFVMEGDDSAVDSFAGTIKGYLNGQLFGQAGGVHLLYDHTDDVAIGARNEESPFHDYIYNGTWFADFYNEGNLVPYDGWIAHVALYNTALQPDRVMAHYEAGMTEVPVGGGIKSFSFEAGTLTIEFDGILKAATSVQGPYQVVTGAASPYQTATSEDTRFFLAE